MRVKSVEVRDDLDYQVCSLLAAVIGVVLDPDGAMSEVKGKNLIVLRRGSAKQSHNCSSYPLRLLRPPTSRDPRNDKEGLVIVGWVKHSKTHRLSFFPLGWWVPFHSTHPTFSKQAVVDVVE